MTPGLLAATGIQPFSAAEVLGPSLIGGAIEAFLQGHLLSELLTFYEKPPNNRVLRLTVYWVNFVAMVQMGSAGYNWWNMFITNYGNSLILVGFDWPNEVQPVLTCLMSGPVHGYFIYRCWMSTNRNKPGTIFLSALAALSVISACLTTADTFLLSANQYVPTDVTYGLGPTFNMWLISTAVLDMCITGILLTYLIRSRHQTRSHYLTTLIDRLIGLVWQSASPPCICALLECILFVDATLRGTYTYWTFVPQAILGKLYCISLMITLNSRESLIRQLDATDPHALSTAPGGPNSEFDLRTGFAKPESASLAWTSIGTVEDDRASGSGSSLPNQRSVPTDLVRQLMKISLSPVATPT